MALARLGGMWVLQGGLRVLALLCAYVRLGRHLHGGTRIRSAFVAMQDLLEARYRQLRQTPELLTGDAKATRIAVA
jgi:hypothetical protein